MVVLLFPEILLKITIKISYKKHVEGIIRVQVVVCGAGLSHKCALIRHQDKSNQQHCSKRLVHHAAFLLHQYADFGAF